MKTERDSAIALSARPSLALVLAYANDTSALEEIDRIDLPTAGEVNDLGKVTALLLVTEALAVLGENEAVASLYPLTAEPIEQMKFGCFGALMPETVAGISAAAGKNWDAATSHFENALRYSAEAPHKIDQAQARYWYAKMLASRAQRGDAETARQPLEEAISGYETIGMPRHLEMAKTQVAAL